MAQRSSIEWTDTTWNPSTGCSKLTAGCKHCYAETLAARLKAMGSARYDDGFQFTMHHDKVSEPLSWRSPRKVFVNSMSDLFHEAATIDFVAAVFRTMMATPRHQYQVLTKRPERAAEWLSELVRSGAYSPSAHIWIGASVERADVLDRVDALREVPASVRFLSCEPLLGPLDDLALSGIDWVIVGGESGLHLHGDVECERRALVRRAAGRWIPREDRSDWVRTLRDACLRSSVPFFFKQWGGPRPKSAGRELDGRTWDQYPEHVEPAAAE